MVLSLILLVQLIAGGLATIYTEEAEGNIRASLNYSIKSYNVVEKNAMTLLWDYGMANMQCCGVDSFEDFKHSKDWSKGGKQVPESCCVLEGPVEKFQPKDSNCPKSPTKENSYKDKGCYKALKDEILEIKIIAIIISVGLILLQIMGVIFTFYLCASINRMEVSDSCLCC
jgi:hypothetical protein